MSCHGCATPFGFLKKEVGCSKCGFSFCKNCLRFKIPNEKNKMILVCKVCYSIATEAKTPIEGKELSRQWKETTAAIRAVRRLESLDNPAKPPITVYTKSNPSRLAYLQRGLTEEDQKIVERLKELRSNPIHEQKARRKSEPIQEISERLAKLRGEEPSKFTEKTSINLTKRPETEQELIERLATQVELDKEYEAKMTVDIYERLRKLRGSDEASPSRIQSSADMDVELDEIMDEGSDDSVTEEQQVQKIINQFVSQVALEEKLSESKSVEKESSNSPMESDIEEGLGSDEEDDFDDEETCRICEEKRATLKCKECDGDIFCNSCFKEFHLELGENHKSTSVKYRR